MNETLQPGTDGQETLILQSVDRFLERDVRPVAHALEAADTYPAEIVEKLKTLGLFGATIAAEYDGLGLPVSTYEKSSSASRRCGCRSRDFSIRISSWRRRCSVSGPKS